MKITVETPNFKKVTIDVSLSVTIDDVKEKVQELTGIPPEQQNLGLDDQNLDGKATLSDAGLKDWSTIRVFKDVKEKVQELTGIPPEHQNLGLDEQNVDGKATLSDAGLKHRSTIRMSKASTTSTTSTPEPSEPSDSDPEVQEVLELEKKWRGEHEALRGEVKALELNQADFKEEVKSQFEEVKSQFKVERAITDDKIAKCKAELKDQITHEIAVLSGSASSGTSLDVAPSSDLASLKPESSCALSQTERSQQQERVENILVELMDAQDTDPAVGGFLDAIAMYLGRDPDGDDPLNLDGLTVSALTALESYITTLRDIIPMRIIVVLTPEGQTFHIDCKPSDTIDDVSTKVYQLTGIPPEQQHLSFEGKNLDGEATLSDTGLKDGDSISLSERSGLRSLKGVGVLLTEFITNWF